MNEKKKSSLKYKVEYQEKRVKYVLRDGLGKQGTTGRRERKIKGTKKKKISP